MVNRTRINDGKVESPEVSTDEVNTLKSNISVAQIETITGKVTDQPINNLNGGGLEHDGNGNLQVDSDVFTGTINGISNPLTGDLDAAGYSINNLFGLSVKFLNNVRYVTQSDSIQNAIDDVSGINGKVILDNSTFNQSFTIADSVTVVGRGRATQINPVESPITLEEDAELKNVRVENNNNISTELVQINRYSCNITNCQIQNGSGDSIKMQISSFPEGSRNIIAFNQVSGDIILPNNSTNNLILGNLLFSGSIIDSGSGNIIKSNL